MSILKIIEYGNPILREKSKEVTKISKKIKTLITDMLDTMYHANGVGLAAPQLGILKKMFAMSVAMEEEDGSFSTVEYAFVNPKIVSYSVQMAYLKDGEGCLSVEEEHQGYVPRAARITLRGYDMLQDKEIEIRLRGYLAIVAQHEMDHFSGTLFYDKINKENPFTEIENALVIE